MKKAYQKPSMELMQYNLEQIIASSLRINIDSDTSIDSETDMWSNSESGYNIW